MIGITLEARVAALETQNRRLRSFAGALLVLISVPLFAAATGRQTAGDVVRASRFEVVRAGKVVVQIDSDADGGQVIVRNAAGLRAGFLQAAPTGGSLDISNSAGKTVGYFDALKGGGGELCVFNEENKCVAIINTENGGGSMRISDRQQKKAATLTASLIGGGELTIFDSNSRRAAYLKAGPYGGSLDISKGGETVGYFDATSYSTSSIGVLLCVGKTTDGCAHRTPAR